MLEKAADPAAAPAYRPEQSGPRSEIAAPSPTWPGSPRRGPTGIRGGGEKRSPRRNSRCRETLVSEWEGVAALSHELDALGRLCDIEGRPPDRVGWYGTFFGRGARGSEPQHHGPELSGPGKNVRQQILGNCACARRLRSRRKSGQAGGILRLRRHPRQRTWVTGPLARCRRGDAARDRRITGEPDIVRRQKITASARDRWRRLMRQYDAEERAKHIGAGRANRLKRQARRGKSAAD